MFSIFVALWGHGPESSAGEFAQHIKMVALRSLIHNNLQSRIPIGHRALRADRSSIAVFPIRVLWLDAFAESNINEMVGAAGPSLDRCSTADVIPCSQSLPV